MKVIDSSSLAKYVNKEPNWEEVAKRIAEGSSSLEFAILEVGNSIWKRVLKKEIPQSNASTVFQEFVKAVLESGLVTLVPLGEDLFNSSLKLAITERITVYDSAFIELAHRNRWGLITSDERQRDISKKRFASMAVEYIK
ncbi:MAG: type II toxin-antitoxin system VapC family toxin [Nitrososphaerota archaeon]|nr:type II toxin-antitoxin system VapC family toxin [Nitrososphaerota archaeon]